MRSSSIVELATTVTSISLNIASSPMSSSSASIPSVLTWLRSLIFVYFIFFQEIIKTARERYKKVRVVIYHHDESQGGHDANASRRSLAAFIPYFYRRDKSTGPLGTLGLLCFAVLLGEKIRHQDWCKISKTVTRLSSPSMQTYPLCSPTHKVSYRCCQAASERYSTAERSRSR